MTPTGESLALPSLCSLPVLRKNYTFSECEEPVFKSIKTVNVPERGESAGWIFFFYYVGGFNDKSYLITL